MSRRTTLGPLTAGQVNSRSSLGPARKSLGPTKSRYSMAPSVAQSGRHSLAPSRMSTGGNRRQSTAAGLGRRSSVYSSNSGQTAGAPQQRMKDPRPIGDKAYTTQCIRTLIRYLTEHGYDQAISPKILTSPTARDFQHILSFLLRKMDPNFQFSGATKPEEEIPGIFKRFGYPFSISKRVLQAVGSPHTWPTLLAALVWLVELLQYTEAAMSLSETQSNTATNTSLNQSVAEDVVGSSEKLFFNYLGKAYECFLAGEDDFNVLDEDLERTFSSKNGQIETETETMKQTVEELKAEIADYRSKPSPLEEFTKKEADFNSDIQKFQTLIQNLEQHLAALKKKVAEKKTERAEKQAEVQQLESEKASLQAKLDTQELSQEDVQRINSDRNRLQSQLQELQTQREAKSEALWAKQSELTKAVQEVEMMVSQFNMKGQRLKMVPATAKYANGHRSELKFTVTGDSDAQTYVLGVVGEVGEADLKGKIREHISELKQTFLRKSNQAQEDALAAQEQLDESEERRSEAIDTLNRIQNRLKKLEATYSEEREKNAEELKEIQTEIEDLEQQEQSVQRDLRQAATTQYTEATVEMWKSKVQQEKQRHQDEAECASRQLIAVLDTLTLHKGYVQEEFTKVEKAMRKVQHELRE